MNVNLARHELKILLDSLDLLLGAYPPDTAAQIQERYGVGTDDRRRVLQLIDRISLLLGEEAA